MEFFKKYGTKERLYEMMNGVNKNLLKEGFDYNDAERDHLGQQDLEAQQADDLKAAQAKEPATDTAPIHPEHPDNTGGDMLEENNLKKEIAHQTDGPVTDFVAISRAIELAYNQKAQPSEIANALSEVLEDIKGGGTIPSNEFPLT